jgi:hypothetical protein
MRENPRCFMTGIIANLRDDGVARARMGHA